MKETLRDSGIESFSKQESVKENQNTAIHQRAESGDLHLSLSVSLMPAIGVTPMIEVDCAHGLFAI